MQAPQAKTRPRNHLLAVLPDADYRLLQPHLEALDYKANDVLEWPNEPITHIVFPDDGLISVVAISSGDNRIEAGVIGRDGMTGIPVVMGNDRSPHSTFVQMSGSGHRIAADALRAAMAASPSLHGFLLHNAQAFMAQTTHTALANGRAKIEERLARWILMAHDRTDGDNLALTHEFIGLMLGVRRSGVTVALHVLEGHGLIRSTRGIIVVQDRLGLEQLAGGIYGVPEAEYLRLTGWTAGRVGAVAGL